MKVLPDENQYQNLAKVCERLEFAPRAPFYHVKRSLGVFASGLSEDLGDTFESLIDGLEEALTQDIPPESQKNITNLLAQAKSSAMTCWNIKAYSKEYASSPVVSSLHDIIRKALKLVSIPRNTSLALKVDCDPELPPGRFLVPELTLAIANLLENSVEAFHEDGGHILVETRLQTSEEGSLHINLTVRDNGCGIDAHALPFVFEPFHSTKGIGHGIGLALVHRVVSAHNGTIRIASEEGAGTEVTIQLPVQGADQFEDNDSPVTLLVVDDDEGVRKVLERLIQRMGYQVVLAENGLEAYELVRKEEIHFDGIISDITMPGLSGTELATQLLDQYPEIPIVLMTGFTTETMKPENLLRLSGYLEKPIRFPKLQSLIDDIITTRRG